MTTLKDAREQGKLDQFIKEHQTDPDGDADKASRVVEAMAKRSIGVRPTSSRRNRDG